MNNENNNNLLKKFLLWIFFINFLIKFKWDFNLRGRWILKFNVFIVYDIGCVDIVKKFNFFLIEFLCFVYIYFFLKNINVIK